MLIGTSIDEHVLLARQRGGAGLGQHRLAAVSARIVTYLLTSAIAIKTTNVRRLFFGFASLAPA